MYVCACGSVRACVRVCVYVFQTMDQFRLHVRKTACLREKGGIGGEVKCEAVFVALKVKQASRLGGTTFEGGGGC